MNKTDLSVAPEKNAPRPSSFQNWAAGTSVCPLCGSEAVRDFIGAPDRFHGRKSSYQLRRCLICACVWLPGPPSPEEMAFHYDEEYHHAISSTGSLRTWKENKRLVTRYKNGGALLDIGCSSGAFLSAMQGKDWNLFGIEMESTTAEKARLLTGADVFVGNATDAPFPPESFDVITAFDVLEHVYDPRAFVSKVHEWLKPGGVFVAMLPNIDAWEARLFGSYWYGLELPRHLFHFSPHSLQYLAQSLSFPIIHLKTPRTCYANHSLSYLRLRAMEKMGRHTEPLSRAAQPEFSHRVARKMVRVGLIAPFAAVAGICGAGGSMEAVLQKPMHEVVARS